jgi:hypothetical protein
LIASKLKTAFSAQKYEVNPTHTTMRNLQVFIFLMSLSFSMLAQSGPGGVGSSANNVFWFDVDRLGATNNSDINSLTDFSGNGNDATYNNGPTYLSNQVNGKDVINFNGTSELLSIQNVDQLDNDGSLTWIGF